MAAPIAVASTSRGWASARLARIFAATWSPVMPGIRWSSITMSNAAPFASAPTTAESASGPSSASQTSAPSAASCIEKIRRLMAISSTTRILRPASVRAAGGRAGAIWRASVKVSSTQKTLPPPDRSATPMRPPIRSTS